VLEAENERWRPVGPPPLSSLLSDCQRPYGLYAAELQAASLNVAVLDIAESA
jgi:hypothetical protein